MSREQCFRIIIKSKTIHREPRHKRVIWGESPKVNQRRWTKVGHRQLVHPSTPLITSVERNRLHGSLLLIQPRWSTWGTRVNAPLAIRLVSLRLCTLRSTAKWSVLREHSVHDTVMVCVCVMFFRTKCTSISPVVLLISSQNVNGKRRFAWPPYFYCSFYESLISVIINRFMIAGVAPSSQVRGSELLSIPNCRKFLKAGQWAVLWWHNFGTKFLASRLTG